MPPSRSAHGLGPHVVGQRVVVRRVLAGRTGPSGGPAMTDVLGTCLSWGEGVCVVSPDSGLGSGEPVVIRIADIVSGKPVPPRPSPRLRITARDAQIRGFALFPDLVVTPLEGPSGWLLRTSATATARRANSVLAFPRDPAGTSSESRRLPRDSHDVATVTEVAAYYARLGQPPIAAVLGESKERDLFARQGWVPESHDTDTLFQVAGVSAVSRALRNVGTQHVTVNVDGDVAEAIVPGRARGYAAYADDWVGFRSIEVDPGARRQGLGRTVMAALVEWGAERGAITAYLQVLGDNEPALALYAGMGFTTQHAYAYLTPP